VNTEAIKALNEQYLLNTYGARKLALVRGEGAKVWDAEGREYLDFFAGISVANLGHCHPAVTDAISEQARTLCHVSNLYYTGPQVELARLLSENTAADRWFFANCGATANEAAIKLARRYWAEEGTPKPGIISARNSFHGRTMATLTATGQERFQQGFEPLLPGFTYVPFDDLDRLRDAIKNDTGAILLEPIQGEGGVRTPSPGYFAGVRELCDERGLLLILDEVQTGMGRTGRFCGYEHEGIQPDIITLAKALGNGVPIGAMGCAERVAHGFAPGSHASTFGGNPVCAAAAVATVRELLRPGFLDKAAGTGERFVRGLRDVASRHGCVVEVRGRGLMIGVELDTPVAPVVDKLREKGVLCGPAGAYVLRFLPPLIVTEGEVDQVTAAVDEALGAQ